jgi:hypothetical protein
MASVAHAISNAWQRNQIPAMIQPTTLLGIPQRRLN